MNYLLFYCICIYHEVFWRKSDWLQFCLGMSHETWLHTALTGHFSRRQEFECKDVLWRLILLWLSESYSGESEGFPRRPGCISFPSKTYSWNREKDGFAVGNWTPYVCISVCALEVSKAKAKYRRARLWWLELRQVHSLRAPGKEAEMQWPLADELHWFKRWGVLCKAHIKMPRGFKSSWKTLSYCSVLYRVLSAPGCPAFPTGTAHGHRIPLWLRPCLSLSQPRKDGTQKGDSGEQTKMLAAEAQ